MNAAIVFLWLSGFNSDFGIIFLGTPWIPSSMDVLPRSLAFSTFRNAYPRTTLPRCQRQRFRHPVPLPWTPLSTNPASGSTATEVQQRCLPLLQPPQLRAHISATAGQTDGSTVSGASRKYATRRCATHGNVPLPCRQSITPSVLRLLPYARSDAGGGNAHWPSANVHGAKCGRSRQHVLNRWCLCVCLYVPRRFC